MTPPQASALRRAPLFLFSHRTLALIRWDLHLLKVRFQNFVSRKESALLKRVAAAERPLYMNLGSGPRGLSDTHWINVDAFRDANVEYLMDFARTWPFPENSLDGIFCEHVFEHFDHDEGQRLLQQSLRVLRPGGSIRLIVPDGGKIAKTYCDDPAALLAHRDIETSCAMDAVNSWFRQRYEHQFIYDWESLKHQLQRAGFEHITLAGFREGERSSELLLDDEKYEWESLYVEAVKPSQAD